MGALKSTVIGRMVVGSSNWMRFFRFRSLFVLCAFGSGIRYMVASLPRVPSFHEGEVISKDRRVDFGFARAKLGCNFLFKIQHRRCRQTIGHPDGRRMVGRPESFNSSHLLDAVASAARRSGPDVCRI